MAKQKIMEETLAEKAEFMLEALARRTRQGPPLEVI